MLWVVVVLEVCLGLALAVLLGHDVGVQVVEGTVALGTAQVRAQVLAHDLVVASPEATTPSGVSVVYRRLWLLWIVGLLVDHRVVLLHVLDVLRGEV